MKALSAVTRAPQVLADPEPRTAKNVDAPQHSVRTADADGALRTVLTALLQIGPVGLVCWRPRLGVLNLDRPSQVLIGPQPLLDLVEASAQAHRLLRLPGESKNACQMLPGLQQHIAVLVPLADTQLVLRKQPDCRRRAR